MATIADLNTDTRDSLLIKVLLWNIHGETSKGYTSARQKVVTFVDQPRRTTVARDFQSKIS